MKQNRRNFLTAMAAGVAVVSLPEISAPLNWLGFFSPRDQDLKGFIHEVLIGQRSGGPFVAHADTQYIEGAPRRLLSPPAGLLAMLDGLGVSKSFSDEVHYGEAAQCKPHFERQEGIWRDCDFTSFTDVNRAPGDSDVAIAVGGVIDGNRHLTRAMGATQYGSQPAVPVNGKDPTIAIAARWLLDKNLAGKEIAQALALTDKRSVAMDGGSTAMRYETPVTNAVFIPQVRLNASVSDAVGIIAANTKKDPDQIYVADVRG